MRRMISRVWQPSPGPNSAMVRGNGEVKFADNAVDEDLGAGDDGGDLHGALKKPLENKNCAHELVLEIECKRKKGAQSTWNSNRMSSFV